MPTIMKSRNSLRHEQISTYRSCRRNLLTARITPLSDDDFYNGHDGNLLARVRMIEDDDEDDDNDESY